MCAIAASRCKRIAVPAAACRAVASLPVAGHELAGGNGADPAR
jgi:hypothetical protein